MQNPVVVSDYQKNRDAWLEARKNSIGSSDAPTVCNLNPYKSPVQLWLEKSGLVEVEELDSEPIRWGNILEDVVAREFQARTGFEIAVAPDMIRHPEFSFATASLDRVVKNGDIVPLEIKTTNARQEEVWENGIPDYAHVQLTHQLFVTGAPFGYVCALIGGQKLVWHRVERNDALIESLKNVELEFWRKVKQRIRPEVRADDLNAVERLFNRSREQTIELNCLELVEEYYKLKTEAKLLDERRDKLEAELKFLLGENAHATCGDWKINWKTIESSRVDSKKLKAEFPDIAEKVMAKSEYRRFEVRAPK